MWKTVFKKKFTKSILEYFIPEVNKIVKLNACMASVALKDALVTVPIHESHWKCFKFEGKGYKFVGMLNGYSDVMRVFTKILKPVYANLRQKANSSVVCVDDSYLQGDA